MAKVLAKLGRIRCHCCGSVVVLKKQANGNPIYTCQECDFKAQAFSADSGRRLLAQCVERFEGAVNDDVSDMESAPKAADKGAEDKSGAGISAGARQAPPPRKSLGAALGELLEI